MTDTGITDEHHIAGSPLPAVSDDVMRERLGQAKAYTVALLRKTESFKRPDVDPVIWEHGRRNFALREHGVLAVVLPVGDDSDLAGIGVFDATPEEVIEIMDGDPGVRAGIFGYEVHPVRGFPGSSLPG
jgi:hypothetical protein